MVIRKLSQFITFMNNLHKSLLLHYLISVMRCGVDINWVPSNCNNADVFLLN